MATLNHRGPYLIELRAGADVSRPREYGCEVRESGGAYDVEVDNGTAKQSMGGLQFHVGRKPMTWGYKCIQRVLDGEGNVLWANSDGLPRVQRYCENPDCGVALAPGHSAVYCTNQCAASDA